MHRRVRLITMAWGDGYIRQLFDYALPAVLAPGNLPALAERFDCEMVIVTSENWFDRLRRHPVYRRISELCPLELRAVDEFVNRPDAYGMALTHALFRGFEELGAAMLDTHLVFFNADFILADGSLRSVARKIDEGERLILSPSYCVVLEEMVPQLAARRTSDGEILGIPPREMAALALRHRHNTIRGKTVNQRLFSMEWIDQFYWLVDERTLIAHQLPIAVVAMRPTRILTEMRTYWDYGIISEACPGVAPCVLSDSDDFLMIELRRADTAREQISLGWPMPREIAGKLEKFITRDPVSLARHTLVLHSGDLPPDLDRAKAELDAYVDSVLRELPDELTDHVNHPNWAYHYQHFQQARREYLIRRGLLEAPLPAEPEPADSASGEMVPDIRQPQIPIAQPRRTLPGRIAFAAYRRIFGLAPDLRPWHPRWSDVQPVLRAVAAAPPEARMLVVSSEELPERLFRNLAGEHAEVRDIIGVPVASDTEDRPEEAAPAETVVAEPDPPAEMPPDLPSPPAAAVPAAAVSAKPDGAKRGLLRIEIEHDLPVRIATSADAAPRAAHLRALQLVFQEAEDVAAAENEAPDPAAATATPFGGILGQPSTLTDTLACEANSDGPEEPAASAPSQVVETRPQAAEGCTPSLLMDAAVPWATAAECAPLALPEPESEPPVTEEFDLCLCEISADDLMRIRPLIRSLAPRLRRDGTILVFHLNHPLAALSNAPALILGDALALDLPCRFHFTGSKPAAQALLGFATALNNLRSRRPAAMARGAIQLGRSLLRTRRASRIGPSEAGRPLDFLTSFVIEISVARHSIAPACAASTAELLQAAK